LGILIDVVSLLLGGLVLYLGAEWLVKGSAGLARAFGVKPLVIGLTVVAYGTSAPELVVSVVARYGGSSEIALGNVIGSCVANLGLILGLTALIQPPGVDGRLIKREVPILLISALAVPVVLWNDVISRFEAGLLLAASFAFTALAVAITEKVEDAPALELPKEATGDEGAEAADKGVSKGRMSLITFVGMALLLGGGHFFVEGARGIAVTFGMSERLVGLTIVAIGTSLPELAASVVAALRGHSGIAVGAVVGSNIFNIFLVLGAAGLVGPLEGSLTVMRVDILFLVGMTLLAVVVMRGSRRITRPEGVILLGAYVAFLALAWLH
jgi:cation:H+ antiporter